MSESEFINEFDQYNRSDNFSYEGRSVLYNYLNEIEFDPENYSLDIIAICCEFTEYENITEYIKDYSTDIDPENYELTPDLKNSDPETISYGIYEQNLNDYYEEIFKEIENKTTLLKIDNSDPETDRFIIQAY